MCELCESHRFSGILLCVLDIVSTADSSVSRNLLTCESGNLTSTSRMTAIVLMMVD